MSLPVLEHIRDLDDDFVLQDTSAEAEVDDWSDAEEVDTREEGQPAPLYPSSSSASPLSTIDSPIIEREVDELRLVDLFDTSEARHEYGYLAIRLSIPATDLRLTEAQFIAWSVSHTSAFPQLVLCPSEPLLMCSAVVNFK